MRHRHLDVDAATPPAELGSAALDNLLDRGDLEDWAPLLREIRRAPWGELAERVLGLVEQRELYGTTPLWRSFVLEARGGRDAFHTGAALRRLRLAQGLTQEQLAARLGLTQPEISKLERRRDTRVSTLRAYVAALGGSLELRARLGDETLPLEPGDRPAGERPRG